MVFGECIFHELLILYSGSTQYDATDAGFQECVHNRHAPNSAAELNPGGRQSSCHFSQGLKVFGAAFECSIEIYNVQPLGAFVNPLGRHLERIAVHGRFGLSPLSEPYSFTAENVDCRIDLHARYNRAKLSRRRSPTCWLFSG